MQAENQYVLGYRKEEQARLQRQAQQLALESGWLFAQIPLKPGSRVLEIGCGPHGCLDILATCVGETGYVTAIECNEEAVRLARSMVRNRNLRNVEVLHGDARDTRLPKNAFDMVTLRLVLVNVPRPEEILREAMSLVRPGGWIALHEADYQSFMCDPPSASWATYMQLFQKYAEKYGIDPFIGRKIPRLLREVSNIPDINVNPLIHVYPPGHERRYLAYEFSENMGDRLVAESMITREEYDSLKVSLHEHISRPDTLVVSHTFFQVWGQKPFRGSL
ncbi:methyltransferase domain-containing protein [Burkholderia sp. MSMB1078WGS]|uniref:methyltransferase domain-containing protein n=1 Tax=Burkholderia sp. MSMB1078WGS TaxID=1637900 RepID=UPI000A4170C4|nr:methyltransferase domain-containing protein [Burkholderia sp. MSMB1078WGS]